MRRAIFTFGIFVVLLPALVLGGTTGKIAGRVTDKTTGDPLPAVNVVIVGTTMGAATDLNGEYFILNVPAGSYSLQATMVGYTPMTIRNIRVSVDLTTTVDFQLEPTVLEVTEGVTVVAERPLIQKDLTASRHIATSEEILALPLANVTDVVSLAPGIVAGHARGGRSGEVIYQIDGISTYDPMDNSFDTSVPEFAVEELSVITGGFSAEYSNAQSGIVNIVTKEGGNQFAGRLRYRTSDYGRGLNKGLLSGLTDHHKEKNLEFSLGGPEPLTNYLLKTYANRINYFIAGEIFKTKGRFPNQDQNRIDVNAKLTYRPTQKDKIILNGLWHDNEWNVWSHLYRNILDHLPEFDERSTRVSLTWNHIFSPKSLLELQLGAYDTRMHYNVNERIDEDRNSNGILDPGEDLNGNNRLDPYGTDLYRDENDNDFIDASEEAYPDDPSKWMPWEDAVIGNDRDQEGYYIYGPGGPRFSTTFYRLRWNNDKKTDISGKLSFTSQLTPRHKIKTGVELTHFDLYDHDVDLASGGNVYGQNIGRWRGHGRPDQDALRPILAGAFIEDKMEFQGLIANVGLRFDYFNAAFDKYPSDLNDPVVNPVGGGQVKNPRKVKPKYYWSPRLGIAHPITDRDVLWFNYGRYFQIPQFRLLFTNINWDLTGAFPLIGNPDIRPETTYSYELGIRHQFTDDLKLELTGFYKDIQGLTDTQQIYYTAVNYYTRFINIDYGNVRGFEVNLYKRYSHYLGGQVTYTYSIAKGKSSSFRQNYDYTWAGNIIPKKENFLDWDQRHTVNANITLRVPKDRKLLFGTPILDDSGIDFVLQYGSGLPYTPPARTREVLINTKRRPWTMTAYVYLDKRIPITKKVTAEVFLWVNNLFNKKNVLGIADVEWYENYKEIQRKYEAGLITYEQYMAAMDLDKDGRVDENKRYPELGRYTDPSYHSETRTYRLGFGIVF